MAEQCESLQGFIIFHAIGGGTGSGLGALLLERLSIENYLKKYKLHFTIYPSVHLSNSFVEPYNCMLAAHS